MAMNDSEEVIVVGAGLSGMATALGVALGGRRATVFEASDKVGGAAAYSGGMVWAGANHVAEREGIEDTLEAAERYVRDIASDHPELLDEDALARWLTTAPEALRHWEEVGAIRWAIIPGLADYHAEADGAAPVGRYLTNEPIDGSELGEWRDRMRISPYFPVGDTYAELFEKGRRQAYVDDSDAVSTDAAESVPDHAGVPAFGAPDRAEAAAEAESDRLTFGTGVTASFAARALREDRVEVLLSHRVVELLTDDAGRVVGVRAEGPDGTVERRGPVVLATSTYDWDPELVGEILELEQEDWGSVAPKTLRGDGIRLVREVGGAIARIPATHVPLLPGWPSTIGEGYAYGPEYALPHSIIVDAAGNRYCDDSYWVDIVAKTLAPGDRHLPFFLVWDSQHHRKYGLGVTPPGGDYPEGLVTSAPTLAELGAALGIDGEQLERTAERFNANIVESGTDPDFGRGTVPFVERFAGDPANEPNPVLGTLSEAPFHGLRLRLVGTGIGSSGVRVDADARVVDEDGNRIEGLYAVGSAAALTTTGSGYNSGFALGRGLTHAYLVSRELTGVER